METCANFELLSLPTMFGNERWVIRFILQDHCRALDARAKEQLYFNMHNHLDHHSLERLGIELLIYLNRMKSTYVSVWELIHDDRIDGGPRDGEATVNMVVAIQNALLGTMVSAELVSPFMMDICIKPKYAEVAKHMRTAFQKK